MADGRYVIVYLVSLCVDNNGCDHSNVMMNTGMRHPRSREAYRGGGGASVYNYIHKLSHSFSIQTAIATCRADLQHHY